MPQKKTTKKNITKSQIKTVSSVKATVKKPRVLKRKKTPVIKPEVTKTTPVPQKRTKPDSRLIVSILISAVLISCALIYLGFQAGGGLWKRDFQAEIRKGIENYVYEQEMLYEEYYNAKGPLTVTGEFEGDRPFLGNADAPVTIIAFSNYDCFFSRQFHLETFPQIKEHYIDQGLVKFVYRNYIFDSGGVAHLSASLVSCIGNQGGNDAFFSAQNKLYETDFDLDEVKNFAVNNLGLNKDKLNSCFDSGEFLDYVDEDTEVAKTIGLTATPTFIINGNVLSGAEPFYVFETFIDEALMSE